MPPGVQTLKLVKLPKLEQVEGVRAAELMAVLELHNVPNVQDLIAIAGLRQLRQLHIEAGPELTDFAFVEGLVHLERLLITVQEVSPSLASVAPLSTLVALQELWLDLKLESVGDVFELFKLPKLRILRLSRLGRRESIRGLSAANALEDVELGDIRVTDGDMTPFLSLPRLRPSGRLFYPDLKHYSHTLQQVNAIITSR